MANILIMFSGQLRSFSNTGIVSLDMLERCSFIRMMVEDYLGKSLRLGSVSETEQSIFFFLDDIMALIIIVEALIIFHTLYA